MSADFGVLVRNIFDQRPKLSLGLDVRPEIPILKAKYYLDTVTKCNGLIILVEGMKTSKLYFCLNAKTEIRMFNANGTKNILIAPLSCKLGPNDYQTTLDK